MAGSEELEQAPVGGLDGGVGPPQLAQLRGGEELVAPDVADDREVAWLKRAVLQLVAAAAFDRGAVVAVRFEIAGRDDVHRYVPRSSNRV